MLDTALSRTKTFIPKSVFNFFQPAYHFTLALSSAIFYGFPSNKIKIIAVTGTKGKSSTVEILSALLEDAGYKTALTNTIRFKVGKKSEENLFKMSMPGRFFLQRFIRRAVSEKCDYLIMEMTSQGSQLFRHKFINFDALVFTNISPEHIESHGSFDNYLKAKLDLAKALEKSPKKKKVIIANGDDEHADSFLNHNVDEKIKFSLKDAEPYSIKKEGVDFIFKGKPVSSPLSGMFNLYNLLAAATTASHFGVSTESIANTLSSFNGIPGRVQKIKCGQDFDVVVDYAHTPDSLEKLYKIFEGTRTICVLGGTGGGRDTWKRAEMGRIADKYCGEIILTDEDPYDEDPNKIVEDVAKGITSKKPTIQMDRRLAIREAISKAKTGDAVLITGKGTDPYIMGPKGTKRSWSDAKICEEELKNFLK